jgi:DNA-binding beta-propeller fold protein YncE
VTRDNDTVARVDPRTGLIRDSTHVGRFPVAVAVGSRSAWVADSAGDKVSEVDVRTGRLRRTIAVGDQPSGVALMAGAVWVVCTGDGRLFRIDPEGCQNAVSSCCGQVVLVQESAESVAPLDRRDRRSPCRRRGSDRRVAAKRSVRSLGVVVIDVDT